MGRCHIRDSSAHWRHRLGHQNQMRRLQTLCSLCCLLSATAFYPNVRPPVSATCTAHSCRSWIWISPPIAHRKQRRKHSGALKLLDTISNHIRGAWASSEPHVDSSSNTPPALHTLSLSISNEELVVSRRRRAKVHQRKQPVDAFEAMCDGCF